MTIEKKGGSDMLATWANHHVRYDLRIDRGSQRVFGCSWRYSIILMLALVGYIHVI